MQGLYSVLLHSNGFSPVSNLFFVSFSDANFLVQSCSISTKELLNLICDVQACDFIEPTCCVIIVIRPLQLPNASTCLVSSRLLTSSEGVSSNEIALNRTRIRHLEIIVFLLKNSKA